MGKLSEFMLNLDSPQVVYYPGQVVSGNVTMTLNEPMKMRSMKLKFKGESYCHWTERHTEGSGKNKKTVRHHYYGKEHIMREEQVFFGGRSESEMHPAGTFEYQFSFTLRVGIPSSFEGCHGYIRYVLKCTIDKPWKFDHKVKRPIVVNDIIDTNNPMYGNSVGGERHKEVGCLCCKAGPLELSSSIDRSCYCPGEAIFVNANVQNKTTRNMKALNVKLIQTVAYKGRRNGFTKTNTTSEEVAKLCGPGIPKGEDAIMQNVPFGIPAVSPTIANSSIITVNYKVVVYVGVPCGIDPHIEMFITMGTVPFLHTYGQPVQYGTPEDRQGTPDGCFDNFAALPPPPPNVFGYPDMPPPSYSSVVGSSAVNIKKGKDSHTHGDLTYQPVYTFAIYTMKHYKCAFTGKDAFTDAYKVTLENDLWYVVEGKYAKQSYGISDSLIGGNKSAEAEEDGEDGDETVLECNLVTSAKLEEIPSICSKKDFKKHIKTYAQKLVKHVAEKDKERADFLKKELPNFVQTVLGDFDNCKFYATEDDAFDVNGVIIPFKQDCEFDMECDGTTCKIYVLKDGLDEEAY